MAGEGNDMTFDDLPDQPDKMTVPADVKSVLQLLPSTINELQDLPHIRKLNELIHQAITCLRKLLSEYTDQATWEVKTLKVLQVELQKASSLGAKWKKSRLRLLLDKSTFAGELSNTFTEIKHYFCQLQVRSIHEESAKEIREQLSKVIQGLRDEGDGSELNIAETEFKAKLLNFLRASNRSKSDSSEGAISVATWLAEHLGVGVDSIKQELQEIKENADAILDSEEKVDTKLLKQLILYLTEVEEKKCASDERFLLADAKAELKCGLCDCLMVRPVVIDSGASFCKACIEEQFKRGLMICPVTEKAVSKRFVVNVTLQNVISRFGGAVDLLEAESSTEEGESSDANFDGHFSDESLERKVQIGIRELCSTSFPRMLAGFASLIKCVSLPGGPLAVFNAEYIPAIPAIPATSATSDLPATPDAIKAIPAVLKLAKTKEPQISRLAMKFLKALTSDDGEGADSEIIIEVADGLDVLISLMKERKLTRTGLLAAETVANILVNKQVRKTVRSYDGIVPALVAFSNVDAASQRIKNMTRAHRVCIKGLSRLANSSRRGEKTPIIVRALIKLLQRGLSFQPELENLVKDSLVALENQILALDYATSTNEIVYSLVRKSMLELMKTEELVSHSSVLGRMAIVSIMTKLCNLYKECITEHLFLYLLNMIKDIQSKSKNLLECSQPHPQGMNVEDLPELLIRSVELLRFCVTHAKNTAQSVLSVKVEERRTLEELMDDQETSSILEECRLEILSIFEQIDMQSTQATGVGEIAILVKMTNSQNQACRQQAARKLRRVVQEQQRLSEIQEAGGIGALMVLLHDSNPHCQQDALVALQALSPNIVIPTDQLPIQPILEFLSQKWDIEVRNAAVGLLDLMLKTKAVSADKILKTLGALEAILNLLDTNTESPCSQRSASALLEMAKEDEEVRHRITEARLDGLNGLDMLVKYVRDYGTDEFKESLTATLVLFCGSEETYQEFILKADGHRFLLTSLQRKISMEKAAEGLLKLLESAGTTEKVLEAGFVKIAMGSIVGNFACPEIAIGLKIISSNLEGLNQIYADNHSVSALLILLNRCPDPSGKAAAATVIARLYPRLYRLEDEHRRTKLREACDLLFHNLEPYNILHIKEFLEALAAIAADSKGRNQIHESRGHVHLKKYLSDKEDIQGLALKILTEMSSDVSENGGESRDAKRIRNALMEHRIAELLIGLVNSITFDKRTKSMEDVLTLIRNLSLAGTYAVEQLTHQGAVKMLLKVLQRQEQIPSKVTDLTVKALEKFMDDPNGKQVFLREGGVKSLVAVLKVDAFKRGGEVKSFSTIILAAVAKDPQTRRGACEAIYACDILSALNQIMFYGETSRIRWQAAVLMKLLAMYGPTSKVCHDMRKKGCLDALYQLQEVQHCKEMASDVLKFVGERNRDCRKYIENRAS